MKGSEQQVAYRDNTIVEENDLPLSVVFYPSFYGTFFVFSKKKTTKIKDVFFCSCNKKAISNFLKLKSKSKYLLGWI